MIKIEEIHLHNLRNSEHFELMQYVAKIITDAGAGVLKVEEHLSVLKNAIARESEAMNKITKSVLTSKIAEADRERDNSYRGLLSTLRAATVHFDPAMREVAKQVMIPFETFGNVARLAIAEESAEVHALCRSLLEKYAAECETLGLSPWVRELQLRNEILQQLMQDRFYEVADKTDLILRDVRPEVDAAYKALADLVFARGLVATVDNDTALAARYTKVIGLWNGMIERTENIIAARRGKAKARKKKKEDN